MNSGKIILAALVIFIAGVVTGRVLDNRSFVRRSQFRKPTVATEYAGGTSSGAQGAASSRTNPISKPPGWSRLETLRRVENQMDLSDEQRRQVEEIMLEGERRARAHWDPAAPKIRDEIRWTRDSLLDIFTPEQRSQFFEISRREQKREFNPDQQRRYEWLRNATSRRTNSESVVPLR